MAEWHSALNCDPESYVVSAVQMLKPYLLAVTFADGERRVVDMEPELLVPTSTRSWARSSGRTAPTWRPSSCAPGGRYRRAEYGAESATVPAGDAARRRR